jgi:hypothetical protein
MLADVAMNRALFAVQPQIDTRLGRQRRRAPTDFTAIQRMRLA